MLINWQATGNPVYPFFQGFGFESEWFFNGFGYWLSRPLRLFFDPVYRLGPAILLVFLLKPKLSRILILSFLFWFLMPGTDFGRFALFPLALMAISLPPKLSRLAVILIIFQAAVGITGRAVANSKYLPVLADHETKAKFLTNNLKFDFGDWVDADGWFAANIKEGDRVLVYGVHNLYYLNFPYDHESWSDPNTKYTYIMVGDNQKLPEKYGQLPLVYENHLTRTKVYDNSIN
jgi:hypothetical protein